MHNKHLLEGSDLQEKCVPEKSRQNNCRIQPYILLFLPHLYYNCADIKENLTTIQMLPWQLPHAILCESLGNSSLCPIKHYSFFFFFLPALQLLKHYGTLDKENKYCTFNGFLICYVYTDWHTINYYKYYHLLKNNSTSTQMIIIMITRNLTKLHLQRCNEKRKNS